MIFYQKPSLRATSSTRPQYDAAAKDGWHRGGARAEPAAELSARGGFRIQQLWLPAISTLSLNQLARLQRESHGPSAAMRECKAYAKRVGSSGLAPVLQ
jgi:hypothetical protein